MAAETVIATKRKLKNHLEVVKKSYIVPPPATEGAGTDYDAEDYHGHKYQYLCYTGSDYSARAAAFYAKHHI